MIAVGNLKRLSIPLVIRWVKTVWERVPVEMVCKSFLKCGMDRTEDESLYEDFLGEGVAETEDVAYNNNYADYYDNSPATNEILGYPGPAFSWMTRMILILRDFNHINRQKTL